MLQGTLGLLLPTLLLGSLERNMLLKHQAEQRERRGRQERRERQEQEREQGWRAGAGGSNGMGSAGWRQHRQPAPAAGRRSSGSGSGGIQGAFGRLNAVLVTAGVWSPSPWLICLLVLGTWVLICLAEAK